MFYIYLLLPYTLLYILIHYYAYLYSIIHENYLGSDPLHSTEDILSYLYLIFQGMI